MWSEPQLHEIVREGSLLSLSAGDVRHASMTNCHEWPMCDSREVNNRIIIIIIIIVQHVQPRSPIIIFTFFICVIFFHPSSLLSFSM